MTYLVKSAFSQTCLYIRHEVYPEGNLGAIKRSLLDNTLGTICYISYDDIISLVGSIAQKVTLKDSLRVGQTIEQTIIGIHHCLQLLGIRQLFLADVYHGVILLNLSAAVKAKNLGTGILKVYS